MIENGADVNAKCSVYKYTDGYTALMYASIRGYYEIVEILLDNKADINATTDLGRTALIETLVGFIYDLPKNGLYETVKILIDRGADIKIKDEDGKTALDYAKEKELKDIEELLINSLSNWFYRGCFISKKIIFYIAEKKNKDLHAFAVGM